MASQIQTSPSSEGFREQDIDSIQFPEFYLLHAPYRHIYTAIRRLHELPEGRAVAIDPKGLPHKIVATKSHVYARRFRMSVKTKTVGHEIVVAKRDLIVPMAHRVVDVPTKKKGETTQQTVSTTE